MHAHGLLKTVEIDVVGPPGSVAAAVRTAPATKVICAERLGASSVLKKRVGTAPQFIDATIVQTNFPSLAVGDDPAWLVFLPGRRSAFQTAEMAMAQFPELFPNGPGPNSPNKVASSQQAVGPDGETLHVSLSVLRARGQMKEQNGVDPSGTIEFSVADLRSIISRLVGPDEFAAFERAPKHVLLKMARKSGLITTAEYNASMPQDMNAVKMYLHSQVTDERTLTTLDRLAVMGSRLVHAASVAINVLATTTDWSFSRLTDQTLVKFLMLPDKAGRGELPSDVLHFRQIRADSPWMANLWPTLAEVTDIVSAAALDNFLQLQGCELSAASKNHVCVNLQDRIKEYVWLVLREARATDDSETEWLLADGLTRVKKSAMWAWLFAKGGRPAGTDDLSDLTALRAMWPGELPIKVKDYELAYRVHKVITPGLNDATYDGIDKKTKKAVQFKKKQRSFCPIFGVGRVYVRLDYRALKGFCDHHDFPCESMDAFLNLGGLRERRKAVRKLCRRNHAKSSVQKRRCGFGSKSTAAHNRRATSFETDGVGLSITYSWNGEPEVREARKVCVLDAEAVAAMPSDTIDVGLDPGRCQPVTTAWEVPGSPGTYDSDRVTRTHMYEKTLSNANRAWWLQHLTDTPALKAAHDAMSEHAWKTTSLDVLTNMVRTCDEHGDALAAERASKEASLWSMRCWRRKASYKDRVASQMIGRWQALAGKAKGEPPPTILLAYGNATFKPTGQGEQAVPTKAWVLAFARAFKRMGAPGGVLMTSEYLTSQMCHRCECLGKEMRADGRVLRDVRCCQSAICAANQNNRTVRNRDKNAAINIMKAGRAFRLGQERPFYLTKAGMHARGRCPPPPDEPDGIDTVHQHL